MNLRSLFLLLACFYASFAKSQNLSPSAPNDSTLIAFASDTQAPMLVETILLKPTNNRSATKMLFKDIASHRPNSLFLLGDVVNLGYSTRQWKPMDKYLDALRDKNIGVYAILGNHEVMGRPRKGQRKFQNRFPEHVKTGYVRIVDSVAVVLLNSNFKTMSIEENEEQLKWYKETVAALDANPAVQYVITTCHHSPFTNSSVVSSNQTVQKLFAQPFLDSKKGKLFLSGHSHNFEHYQVEGKDFLVIGGGGGLHQPLKTGGPLLVDLQPNYKPLFHYLTVQRVHGSLQVTSYNLKSDFSTFQEGLKLTIPTSTKPVLQTL